MEKKNIILSLQDLSVSFTVKSGINKVIRNCSLDLYEGEILAIVGESGSGKSVINKSMVGMLDKNGFIAGGKILFHGQDLSKIRDEKEWSEIRGKKIAMVMQDPMTALDPLMTVGKQIEEAILLHRKVSKQEAKEEAIRMLQKVGITEPERRYRQYPHELSGGQRQRIVIAIACSCKPEILICDEPTTALDVTKQNQILKLIRQMKEELGMTVIIVTHDLGVVANIAERVAVMYAGEFVEIGMAEDIFYDAWHPYTWALLAAIPQRGTKGQPLPSIDGTPPNRYNDIIGDPFAPRNRNALAIDYLEAPPWFDLSESHRAKTWLLDPRCQDPQRPDYVFNFRAPSENSSAKKNSERKESGCADAGPADAGLPPREKLIEVKNLQVSFGEGASRHAVVNHVTFDIYRGETFSVVGESGSGKSTVAKAIMRINPCSDGEILYKGQKISGKISKELDRKIIKEMQMVFQDPQASLNDRAKVDYIISEGLYNFGLFTDEADRQKKVLDALHEVGLQPKHASRFPHEFSGGQRQRIGIARALIMEPEFIVADEPISALDVSIRAQVLNLLHRLKKEHNLTYLFIAHDLSIVRFISDRVAVIHKGRIVELAETEELYQNPIHPYTKSLLSAAPIPDPILEKQKQALEYEAPDGGYENAIWTEVLPGHFVLMEN